MGRIIALMTDFGLEDIYVGVMKGVIARICPDASVIDVTHAIPAQSVVAGAVALRNSYAYFPPGTIFVAIVDPDVGSDRNPLLVQAGEYFFVAPDNGVLSRVLSELPQHQAWLIENRAYALPTVSATFHGRDIFAPAAAYLATGAAPSSFGQAVPSLVMLVTPALESEAGSLRGVVAHVDHFGNIITTLEPLAWRDEDIILPDGTTIDAARAKVLIHTTVLNGIQRAYYAVPEGELLAQIDSTGALEVAIYKGNAAARVSAKVGDVVTIVWEA